MDNKKKMELPRLPPWESPRYYKNKNRSPMVSDERGRPGCSVPDPTHYTPLINKYERKRERSSTEATIPENYDPSPFLTHGNILNRTKIDQLKQQEVSMRRVFDKERSIPESRINTPYFQRLWRDLQEKIEEEVPESSPKFSLTDSPQDLYKQLRQFQTTFIQEEAWKYEDTVEDQEPA